MAKSFSLRHSLARMGAKALMRLAPADVAKTLVSLYPEDSKQVASQLLAGLNMGGRGDPPRLGAAELLAMYNQSPWIRAVANFVGNRMSAVQWKLYGVKGPRGTKAIHVPELQRAGAEDRRKELRRFKQQGRLIEVELHPFLDAMARGNTILSGKQVRKLLSIYTDLNGEGPLLKQRNAFGLVEAYWPLNPSWLRAMPTPQNPFWELGVKGFEAKIPDTEILWFHDPNVINPYGRGVGIANALGDEIATDESAAKHLRSFFGNRALPPVIISGPGMQPDDVARLEDRWKAKARDFFSKFVPFFLNNSISVQEVGQSLQEMQITELRKQERDVIIQTWGIPPENLGIIENSNRSTIDGAEYLVGVNVLVPRLETQREIFQERQIPEYDERLVVDYVSPVKADQDFQQKVMAGAPFAFKVDEHRELGGLQPLENDEGQVFVAGLGLQAVQTPGELGGVGDTGTAG